MKGYYKEPELTRASFTDDGFLKTGDRGEIDGEGRLKITGRVKELFKTSKGKYVAPAPIENLLKADQPRRDVCCVIGRGPAAAVRAGQLAEQLRKRARKSGRGDRGARSRVRSSSCSSSVNKQIEEYEQLTFWSWCRRSGRSRTASSRPP